MEERKLDKKAKDPELALFQRRKQDLQSHRESHTSFSVEDLMRSADRDYELKPLNPQKTKGLTYGENWRLSDGRVELTSDDTWQSDNSDSVVFSKIQTALSLLFDRNPSATLTPKSKRYVTTELAKAILEDSHYREDFKDKIKLFVFNIAKYGWGAGRTFVCEKKHEFEDLTEVNPITGEKKYEKKEEVHRYVNFKPLNNWNVWIDERALPYQSDSIHDWMWREVYSDAQLRAEFGTDKAVEDAIKKKTEATEKLADESADNDLRTDLNEVFFYENIDEDRIIVVCNDIKIYSERLPAHKKLSLVHAFWNLRNDTTIFGIGLPEIMRQDKNLLDKLRNMSIDQLVLSIYKMFFYDGTSDSEDMSLKIFPGRGQKIYDPSKLRWLEVPSGGPEAYQREEMLRSNLDESTGINKTLAGGISENPNVKALALQQAKESALAKLKVPLDNILGALRTEAKLRWSLIQELNMFPLEVEKLVDPKKAEAYMQEVEYNEQLYHIDTKEMVVYALKYPEVSAKVKKNDQGIYRPSEERNFFAVTPELIRWQGDIYFSAEAILVINKELQKQMDLDMSNMLAPLLMQPPQVYLKLCKQILKIYGKDEEDWLPDFWLHPQAPDQGGAPPNPDTGMPMDVMVPPGGGNVPAPAGGIPPVNGPANTVVTPRETEPGRGTTSVVDKMTGYGLLE